MLRGKSGIQFVVIFIVAILSAMPLFAQDISEDAVQGEKGKKNPKETFPLSLKKDIQEALKSLPEACRSDVAEALRLAGENANELIKAIYAVGPQEREGLVFLLVNMPLRDLTSLKSDFLIEDIRLAYQVLEEVPWGKDIPKNIFLNNVLPYASLNERRDNWRADFHQRFLVLAIESGSIEKAVRILNEKTFNILGVTYGTQRPKPDQSPYESMEAHYASCTGLSILLVDVLRSVGVPSRVVGVPLWTNGSGNHTWVEVWDQSWHHVGAEEPAPYDEAWFNDLASQADATQPQYSIYASSFKKTGLKFPLVWDQDVDYVSAFNVTERYVLEASE